MYCNVNTKKCSDRDSYMYKFLYGHSPPCCRSHLYTLLKNTDEILSKANIKYWIIAGTLLGAVRDNDIIKIDEDVDLGLFIQDKERLLNLILEFYNYGMSTFYDKSLNVCSIRASNINMNHLDIHFYEKNKNNKYISNAFQPFPLTDKMSFLEKDLEKLDKVRIRDHYFFMPRNPIPFLENMYGMEWKSPLVFDCFNLEPPAYSDDTPHIDGDSEDPEERRRWAEIFLKVRKHNFSSLI